MDHAVRTCLAGVLWIARRQPQLESEPCEAVRSNPCRQHGSTRQSQRWTSSYDSAYVKDAQRSDTFIGADRFESRCVGMTGMRIESMRWLNVDDDDAERSKHRLKVCRRRINRWDWTKPKIRVLKRVLGEARMGARVTGNSGEKNWQNVPHRDEFRDWHLVTRNHVLLWANPHNPQR